MGSSKVKIGMVQLSCAEDKTVNLTKTIEGVKEAVRKGAKIVCLQELFSTRYFCRTEEHRHFSLAESIPGPTTDALSSVAKENDVVIVVPLFEKRAAGLYYNSAAVIDADGTLLGTYRKMHIPDDPSFYEKFYFTPGDLGFRAWKTKYGTLGVLICWDQWFPEAARLTALQGAQILFYPTAIGWNDSEPEGVPEKQHEAWQVIQRGHAVANAVYVCAVNRVGKEGELNFWGKSFMVDPFGQIVAETSGNKEEIMVTECDLDKIEETRQYWPFLRDRRVDAYGPINERYIDKN